MPYLLQLGVELEVDELVNTGVLNPGQVHGLIAKVEGVIQKIQQGQPNVAVNKLQAFINAVNDFVNAGTLSAAEGAALTAAAQAIIDVLEAPIPRLEEDAMEVLQSLAETLPEVFALSSNYPNPFNPTTTLPFALPESSEVTIAVYDVTGRRVALLVSGLMAAGHHEVQWRADNLPSGMYLVRMQAGSFSEVRRMTLIK